MNSASYESTYRRSGFAMTALLVLLLALGAAAFAIIRYTGGGPTMMLLLLVAVCCFMLGLLVVFLVDFRVHRWTIKGDGLHIEERPKVPFAGLRREVRLAYSDLAALRRLQGLEAQLEIVTHDGRPYRLAQVPRSRDISVPASLESFAAAIRAAALRAGHELPETTEGLSFWNRSFGLFLLAVMLTASLALAALVAMGLLQGYFRRRGGEFAIAAFMLPFGAGYLLYRSFRRRRAVLAGRADGPR